MKITQTLESKLECSMVSGATESGGKISFPKGDKGRHFNINKTQHFFPKFTLTN